MRKKREKDKDKGPLFTVEGNDVKINRDIKGEWKGYYFSQLMEDWDGRRLLKWISTSNFDDRVKEIASSMIDD